MSTSTGTDGVVQVRPRRVRRVAIPAAAVVLIVCVIAALLLRRTSSGLLLTVSDQVSMAGIGAVLAGLILLTVRPRLRADENGVEVRNSILTRQYAWSDVRGISFPAGAGCARLELPDDEYEPITAIQSVDGEHAVRAMRELRALRRRIGQLE
ncbi:MULTISPECIES: PH domain-containing protein [Actinopolyspora]|uniref:PH domain-containing protein n=1 Tax=Actinopolyspora saharensis TaxID=995062 RepID=A0A1H0Y7V4_9ACTN|nr:PH domain-containing protein [Actinopolyspora saharensis]NHD17584.1 PH domain-containing protein [Actinopolyspora sp. BKK2]NHE76683.1 PH domain-containing protein [Actinopolyspora sp. BKK1]SDQ11190.1 PH domain-containing protein [Actinopolyspora saharensis]